MLIHKLGLSQVTKFNNNLIMAQQRRLTVSPNPGNIPPKPPVPLDDPVSPPRLPRGNDIDQRLDKIESDSLLSLLKENRQRMCQCFDIYQILFQNCTPQRCLEHNNFLTLYCETQQKLLCVNCIYGSATHRLHHVVPIKNVFEQIVEDNKAMERKLQGVIENIKLTEKSAVEYKKEGQSNVTAVIKQLDDEYTKLIDIITEKYNNAKSAILNIYGDSNTVNDLLMQEIDWIKTTYIDRQKALPRSGQESAVIYTHLMLSTLLEAEKLEPKLVKPLNFEEIRAEYVGDLSRIREMIETGKVKQRRGMF